MKKPLLEIVQNIINDLDSDEVNSIVDTTESMQVANIVKACYEEIISNRNWPHLKKLVQLEASNDTTKPNFLKAPAGMKELISFHYEKQKATDLSVVLQPVWYKDPEAFLRFVSARTNSNNNMSTIIDYSGTKLLVYNNAAPTYWTTFDDEYIVTDSYDSKVDTTLQKSKTQCLAYIETPFSLADDFIPDLPSEAFSLLEEEAKSTAFFVLKQEANQKAEQKSRRQSAWLSRKAWQLKGGVKYPNYGRKGRI